MKRILLLSCLFVSLNALANDDRDRDPLAEFSGEGLIKTPADHISLMVTVRSECQESPKAAQSATDDVTKKIDDYFQTLKKPGDTHFKILIDGGFSTPYSRWYRVHDRDRELCRNTFQKTTNITLTMAAREDFHQIFSNIQDFVLKQFEQGPPVDDRETPRTYVSMSTPIPDITREHRIKLERAALDLAVKDAKAKFVASIKSCEPHRWKVQSITETGDYGSVRPARFYAKAMGMHAQAEAAEAAPVRFDNLEITKSLRLTFKFEGALCYEKAMTD